ncbi:amino acid permease [Natranaeroarchaeum sulfidigenes]|uniref:Amino acid transporter n=1 Tax=Natranaeroarchaeum sulfidigenes TaxID=2784880 RepID=A0A897MQW6_9EURY|nr:amino acid permease [Natranaeroarchaeum sulfidigenes]QSG01369.1 Amino acid transporter [Natranaeroarchaeum sulfidigenes]
MAEELERDLGLVAVVAISMGAMIGSGIFILPGLAMAEAGPSVILAFVIAALLVLPAAISIAELGTAMPEAGGDYIFIERGMGPGAGTIAGLGTWLMLMFKGALALVGGMLYLGPIFDRLGVDVSGELVGPFPIESAAIGLSYALEITYLELIAVVIGALLITINVVGVKQTGGLQKILVLVMMFILGGFVALSMGNIEGGSYDGFFEEGAVGLFAATAMVLISYGGVTKVAAVAEEIKNPGRNLPLGLLLSLGLTTALYALIVFVLVGVVDAETLAGSDIPMVDGTEPFFGFIGVLLIIVAAMFALISTANAGILTASRYPFALSRDNLLPDEFATVSDRFHTPVTAILITGGAMLFIIITLPVEEIAKTAGAFQIVVYILVCLSLIAFRRRDPEWYDPDFRSPLYPWIQLFGVFAGLGIITQMDLLPQVGGIGIALLGALWYWVYGRPRVDRTGIVGEALIDTVEPTPEGGESPYRVVVPVASPETERGLIRLAAASAASHDGEAELVVMNVITVPDQTSLAQEVSYEQERIDRQQELLAEAEEIATELDIGLRTRALVGRDVGKTVLHVIEQENADDVVMGWSGTRKRRDRVLGSNIDRLIEQAPCEVTLVRYVEETAGDVVAFVGEGPYSSIAVRKAAAIARMDDDATLTLVNVQTSDGSEETDALVKRGQEIIDETARSVDVEGYESNVVVTDDVESELVKIGRRYDTVCLGVSRVSSVERLLSGAIPETIGEQVPGTILLVRSRDGTERSLRAAIRKRLSV